MISTLYHLISPITFKGLHDLVWDIVEVALTTKLKDLLSILLCTLIQLTGALVEEHGVA